MKLILIVALITGTAFTWAGTANQEQDKEIFLDSVGDLLSRDEKVQVVELLSCKSKLSQVCNEQRNLVLLQLEEFVDDNRYKRKIKSILEDTRIESLLLPLQIKISGLLLRLDSERSKPEIERIAIQLKSINPSRESLLAIASNPAHWNGTALENWEEELNTESLPKWDWLNPLGKGPLPAKVVKDLFTEDPAGIGKYKNGRYEHKPRLYMFCRNHRQYPCLMLLKDKDGQVVRNSDGSPWARPSLGHSRKERPYYQSNGNTPSGVWRLDSVMPKADKKFKYGDYRRLVMNFVQSSQDEEYHKLLLPNSSHSETWWRQAVVARDNGRGLFRVHGTGWWSFDDSAPYHPFVRTIGCVAQREKTYDDVKYKDQRSLLDALMKASGLKPTYDNETKIRGLLYVVNIDGKKAPVTLTDLKAILPL